MSNLEQIAAKRIMQARTELVIARRFYGACVANVEPVISRKVETAATNSKQHLWNPDYIATLSQENILFVQAHESEHDVRHHSTRRGARDPLEWNISTDYSINGDLIAEGIGKPPKGILYDKRFVGLSAEDIYRIRELERQQKQEQPEQPKGDEGETEEGLEQADTDPGKGQDEPQDDTEGQEKPQDDTEGQDAPQGDEQGQDGDQPGDEQGDEPGEAPGEAAGKGKGEAGEEGTPGAGEATSEAPGGAVGDVGGCGEVLDYSGDANERADQDIAWEKVTRQATFVADKFGQLPGHISREIERANNPPRNWRDELREFAEQGALRTETWNRPNRRFSGRGLILPSTQKDGVNKAVFIIDTSGSMDVIALACIQNETQALLDDGVIDEVVVLYGDTRLTREDSYKTGDVIEFDPRGGGGTNMRPMFQHVAEQHDDASLVLCFTDGYIGDPGPEPHCPVLWAYTGYPQVVREMIANAPWGAHGIDVGAH
jgi:predicted metal-dependent peptidase